MLIAFCCVELAGAHRVHENVFGSRVAQQMRQHHLLGCRRKRLSRHFGNHLVQNFFAVLLDTAFFNCDVFELFLQIIVVLGYVLDTGQQRMGHLFDIFVHIHHQVIGQVFVYHFRRSRVVFQCRCVQIFGNCRLTGLWFTCLWLSRLWLSRPWLHHSL